MPRVDRELWHQLEPFVDRALELTPPERESWLAALRESNPEVAVPLAELFISATALSDSGFLERRVIEELVAGSASHAGERVGAWTLDRQVGVGGMGSVWLAHRADDRFEGIAAVKLLNVALFHAEGMQRFRREGTVLAKLTHPNIARLLDAGVSAASQPYLVLEYVDGERLDRWCDGRGASSDERIALFHQVLAAVAHAHTNLVVHRDLKPSNVMVTREGVVKLLDFGIAKLLDVEADERTELGRRLMTPEYAAPEQVNGEPIGTATDVYALGVLLYRLLTGAHPTGEGATTPAQHLRAIVQVEPLPMSQVVMQPAQAGGAAERAVARSATPERLRRRYAGDLDNIVARALRKEPGERYTTVAGLSDDLGRWARHEPVLARPASLGYRLTRFARRNLTAVAAAGFAALTLVTATVFSMRQAAEARRQRDEAQLQARRARAKTDFQTLLLGFLGEGLSPSEMLARGRRILEQQRGDRREAGHLLMDLGVSYLNAADYRAARDLFRQARAIADSVGDADLAASAECSRAWAYATQRLSDSASFSLASAAPYLARLGNGNVDATLDCAITRASLLAGRGALDSAVTQMHLAIDRVAHDSGERGSSRHSQVLYDYARMLRTAGRTREAIAATEQAVAMLDSLGLGETTGMTNVVVVLSGMYSDVGEFTRARQVTGTQVSLLGGDRDSAVVYAPLAYTHALRLELAEFPDSAERWYRRALRDTTYLSPQIAAYTHNGLARILVLSGRPADAAVQLTEAGAWFARLPRRPEIVAIRAEGRLAMLADSNPERVFMESRRLADSLGSTADKPLAVASGLLDLATVAALRTGRSAQAAVLARQRLVLYLRDSLSLTHSARAGKALLHLGEALRLAGNLAGARDTVALALVPLRNVLGDDRPSVLRAKALLDSLTAP